MIIGAHWINPRTGLQGPAAPLPPPPNPPPRGISAGISAALHFGSDRMAASSLGTFVEFNVMTALEIADMLIARRLPTTIASPGEALSSWLAGSMDEKTVRCIVELHGVVGEHFQMLALGARRKPEAVELNVLRNRQVIDEKQHQGGLRQLGFTDAFERDAIRSLRFDVPGPSDLVRFAVRHAFEPEILAALGYHAEYRPALDYYHQTAGLNYKIFTGPLRQTIVETSREDPAIFAAVVAYAREQGVAPPAGPEQVPEWFAKRYTDLGLPEPTWAVMFWWSHWILPSPTQGAMMLGRLRPDRDKLGEPAWMQKQDFTIDDYRLLLRANDYPPFWRDKLAALVYALPGIRYVRVLVKSKVWNEDDVFHLFQKTPYKDSDARALAKAIVGDVQKTEREKLFRAAKKQLDAAWELGLVEDQDFLDNYALAGLPAEEAEVELHAAVAARNVRLGKELLGSIRKAFLRGTFDRGQAAKFMTQVGIVDRRQAEYLRQWDAERQAGRKEATAAQMRKAVIEGMMDLATYARRLRNLDYSDAAIELALADARLAVAERERRALEKLAREEGVAARLRLAALRSAESKLREVRAQLARSASPSKLKAFWCEGSIELPEVIDRLRALGITEEDIPRWLKECDAKRQKAGLPTYDEAKAGKPG